MTLTSSRMSLESREQRSVEVLSLPDDVDEELLFLYFDNRRRSGGGSLVSVEKKGDRALLVFEEAEAAARVLSKSDHVLQSVELTVRKPAPADRRRLLLRGVKPSTSSEMLELYVENMMELRTHEYSLHPSPRGDLVLVHLRQPFSRDVQKVNASLSQRKLEGAEVTLEEIQQTDSILVENLHPGTSADVLTLYFESSQRVKEVVMLSEGTAKVSFLSYESVAPVLDLPHKVGGVDLVVKPYFSFLHPKETAASSRPSETASAALGVRTSEGPGDAQPHAGSVVSHAAPEPPAAPETAEELVDGGTQDAETVCTHIAITNLVKLTLVQASTVLEDIEKAHPDFTIQLRDDGVHMSGPDRRTLERIRQTVLDIFVNLSDVHFTLEPQKAQFLSNEDVRVQLLQTMNARGSRSTYTVSGCNVVVTALTQILANQACRVLKSQLYQFSIAVDKEYECVLYSSEWSDFIRTLGFTSVEVSEQGGSIDVLTLTGMEGDKHAAILQFLTTPMEKETFISMEPGVLKYIQMHCHQLLADMDQVSIFPQEAEDVCGLKIHGHAAACRMAEELLRGVVSSVSTKTITVNAPGVTRYLQEDECKSMLQKMETKFQVYIDVKHVPWEPLEDRDFRQLALMMMMSNKNFQRVSADEASEQGLVDEAQLDDLDLYTAEAPPRVSQQDGGVFTAAQPLLDGDAANGVLFSDMDEETQLSLAIQYSMESSSWSIEEEEEQLQKALELSRKTFQENCSSSPKTQAETCRSLSFQDAIATANTLQLVVYAMYGMDFSRVDIAFKKRVSQRQVEQKVEHRVVKNMNEHHKKCLEVLRRKFAVDIELQGNVITVSGFEMYVDGAAFEVKGLLEDVSNAVSDQDILRTVQWVQHDPVTSDRTPYSPAATVFIELAWRMKMYTLDISLDNEPHVLNFDTMQESCKASGKRAKISRKLIGLGEVVPEVEFFLLSNMPDGTKLNEQSEEFENVVKNFYETMTEDHSKIRIIQVEKLMNQLLYHQYELKKRSVLQHSTETVVERTLYHGTSENSVKEICIHGFNRSFCGKNATVYGQGVYFAVNSALSLQDRYSPPNADGHKFIFVSKVLTGDFIKGCHSMKTAPLKESRDIPYRYDSVTDNVYKPTMFVIFNDTQAFPEYLITCQKVVR